MPVLWKKKSRVASISQRLVTDLQYPLKHGGSLVVETGFPTSLVDLFVKSKNRFNKSSSKRKQDNDQDCWEISDPVLTSPLPPHLVCPEAFIDLVEIESRGGSGSNGGIEVAEEEEEVRKSEAVDVAESGEGGGSGRNGMFVNVLRVFFVLVLWLSSKGFTAGVTMSAVSLSLLELVGKWVFRLVVPCSDVQARFERLMDRVHDFFGVLLLRERKCEKGKSLDSAEDGVSLRGETAAVRDVDFRDCSLTDKTGKTDEAVCAGKELIIGADSNSVDQERRGDSLDSLIKMRYAGSKRDEYLDLVSDHKHDRNGKPMSKFMHRIVPKKLKHPKVSGKRSTVSIAAPCEVGKVVEGNYGKVEDAVQAPLAKDHLGKWSGDKKTNEDKDKIMTGVVVVEKPVDGGRERKQRMALMITFAMILSALIGGRFLAVVLTTGYFGSKFIGAVMT